MFLTFDIGGTFIKYGIFQAIEQYKDIKVFKTETTENPVEKLIEITEEILLKNKIKKIGISIAANVNKNGQITNSTNLNIAENLNLKHIFERRFKIKCSVLNDGSAAALGCTVLDGVEKFENFVSITLGTGVGGGIVINDQLLLTKHGFESELGHIVVEENGLKCVCGKLGCVEAYCGNSGIVKRYLELSSNINIKTPLEIKKMADNGEVVANQVIFETGVYLGKAMAIISDIIGPGIFILNGGVSGFGKPLINGIDKILKQRCFSRVKNTYPEVKISSFKYPALIGAALFNN